MSDVCLRESFRSPVGEGAATTQLASCDSNFLLKIVIAGGGKRVLPIEFERLGKRLRKASTQLLARGFLAVHARNLLNPANPPFAAPLDDGCVLHLPFPFLMQIHDSEVYRPQRLLTAAALVFQLDAVALVWGDQSHAQRFAFASQEVAEPRVSTLFRMYDTADRTRLITICNSNSRWSKE